MAKKKKGGKNSGKKKSAKSAKSVGGLESVFNELSKEFYVVQIRDLKTKIQRCQEKCQALDENNKDLENKLEQQAADKKDIVAFLKKQLEQRSDEIADLQEKIIGLQQAKELEKDKYDLEITTVKTEMQEVKDQLTSENMVLGGKLASLEEFRVQKEDLLNKFAEMEDLLKTQEEQHKEQVYQLERKAVVDKDRSVAFVFYYSLSYKIRYLRISPRVEISLFYNLDFKTFLEVASKPTSYVCLFHSYLGPGEQLSHLGADGTNFFLQISAS